MLDNEIAATMRVVGLVGLAFSIIALAYAERSPSRANLSSLSKIAALIFVIVYLFGVITSADSGGRRLLPRFP
jgi:FtsH-binding integral membrane protein